MLVWVGGGRQAGRSKLWRARSRLYRSQILQPNTHFAAFFEIYKIFNPLHRSKRKFAVFRTINFRDFRFFGFPDRTHIRTGIGQSWAKFGTKLRQRSAKIGTTTRTTSSLKKGNAFCRNHVRNDVRNFAELCPNSVRNHVRIFAEVCRKFSR